MNCICTNKNIQRRLKIDHIQEDAKQTNHHRLLPDRLIVALAYVAEWGGPPLIGWSLRCYADLKDNHEATRTYT